MNYSKIYNDLIFKAKSRILSGYKERHHIIPKCLGGSNDKSNLVELTAREHFIAHKLLCKIYPTNNKLHYALWAMINGVTKRKLKITSREYDRIKQYHKECVRQTHYNKTVSTETRKKQSIIRLNATRIKCNHCNIISDTGNIHRWHNDNCKHNPNITSSVNTKYQCIHCGICTTKTNIIRWHNQNCKFKNNPHNHVSSSRI